ncbi:S-adenosyl-L-methionine-dependent methyltransferase [Sporodiniella umbellata]|nr:S-adenosyl-L-methionine-dependent methyltransferase [Sporodiniella umbellata]
MGATTSKDERIYRSKLPSLRSQLSHKSKLGEGDSTCLDHPNLSRQSSWRKSLLTPNDTASSVSFANSEEYTPSALSEESRPKRVSSSVLESRNISLDNLLRNDTLWKEPRKSFAAYKKDDKEYERQLRQHYVLKHILGGNIHVPVSKDSPIIILESACGAGVWTLDMALEYPQAKIIGLEAFHERSESKNPMIGAPNIVYKLGDLASHLQLPADSVDVIYQRDASLIIPEGSWPAILSELKRVAKPGAYIELVECKYALGNPGPILTLINSWYENAARTFGVNPEEVSLIKDLLIQVGFVDVKEELKIVPLGEWHQDKAEKENGFLFKQVVKSFYDSKRSWWVSELKLSGSEYDKLTSAALNEMDSERSFAEYVIFTARKP